jgi:predicted glycoside hydrolase/deacetylase ChbG (UPF0249 family)
VKTLIVNGDDFGISSGVSRGILDAHSRGILTSTSLMVDRPAADEAAGLARRAPGLSVGLHLELEPARGEGRAALDRQLRRFERLMGRPPTHLDSHHDVHRDPRVLPLLLERAAELGIPLRGHSGARCLTRFYGQWGGEVHLEQVSVGSLVGMLRSDVADGVTELVCHPGYADAELQSSYGRARDSELQTLCDRRVRAALDEEGIRLLGFRDLPDLQGAAP